MVGYDGAFVGRFGECYGAEFVLRAVFGHEFGGEVDDVGVRKVAQFGEILDELHAFVHGSGDVRGAFAGGGRGNGEDCVRRRVIVEMKPEIVLFGMLAELLILGCGLSERDGEAIRRDDGAHDDDAGATRRDRLHGHDGW